MENKNNNLRLIFFCALISFNVFPSMVETYENDPTLGPFFEGDILLQEDEFIGYEPLGFVGDDRYRWPNSTIPAYIDKSLEYWSIEIQRALRVIEDNTCVKFFWLYEDEAEVYEKNKWNYIHYANITPDCYSYIGRYLKGGGQILNLGYGCYSHYIFQHETCHALGFYHEHNRKDRDQYVRILWNNIQDGKESNFILRKDSRDFGVPYDYGSIMHYEPHAFAKKGRMTIIPTQEEGTEEFETNLLHMALEEFSVYDFEQINLAFNCPKYYKK